MSDKSKKNIISRRSVIAGGAGLGALALSSGSLLAKEANKDNLEPINQLLQILKNPYIYQKNINEYQVPPVSNKKYQTFCGT